VKHRVVRGHRVEPVGRERERGQLTVDQPGIRDGLVREFEPPSGYIEADAPRREVRERPGAVATADVKHGGVGGEVGPEVVEECGVRAGWVAALGVRLRHLVPRALHRDTIHTV